MFMEQMAASEPPPSRGGKEINGTEYKRDDSPILASRRARMEPSPIAWKPIQQPVNNWMEIARLDSTVLAASRALLEIPSQPRTASQAELRGVGAGMGDRTR